MANVLVKIGKFYFPTDFYVLEMDNAIELPIILGRPFLAMGRSLIDVDMGKLTFRVGVKHKNLMFLAIRKCPQLMLVIMMLR